MDDVVIKGIGLWLLTIIESLFVFFAYLVGHFVNTIPAELAVLIASMLGSSQILIFLIIKKFFKMKL